MKTKSITAIFAFALLLAGSINSYSVDVKERLFVSFSSPGVVIMKYNTGSAEGHSKLFILDAKNNLVYSEVVSKKEKAKLYNIKNLPEGEYIFKVVNKEETTIKRIVYKKEGQRNLRPLNVKVVPSSTGKVSVTCKGVKNQLVNVIISNKSNDVLHEEQIDIKKDFSRLYDLSQVKESSVFLTVSVDGTEVSNEVSLKNGNPVAIK